uniref:Uncharacterized protein n=1 Tax=Anopheles melas TaxID=34690 RepID=A0A182TJL6_9DIPT
MIFVVHAAAIVTASASPARLRDAINSSAPPMQCYQSLLKALRPFTKSKRSCSGGVKFRARQEASALICATSTLTLAVTFATVNLHEDLRSDARDAFHQLLVTSKDLKSLHYVA